MAIDTARKTPDEGKYAPKVWSRKTKAVLVVGAGIPLGLLATAGPAAAAEATNTSYVDLAEVPDKPNFTALPSWSERAPDHLDGATADRAVSGFEEGFALNAGPRSEPLQVAAGDVRHDIHVVHPKDPLPGGLSPEWAEHLKSRRTPPDDRTAQLSEPPSERAVGWLLSSAGGSGIPEVKVDEPFVYTPADSGQRFFGPPLWSDGGNRSTVSWPRAGAGFEFPGFGVDKPFVYAPDDAPSRAFGWP